MDTYLVELLDKAIDSKRKLINECKSMKDLSVIIDNRDKLDAVNADNSNLIYVDDVILKDITNKFYFLDKNQKEELLGNILVIKDLLQSNLERGTTFSISDEQKSYIFKFFENMNRIIIDQQERYGELQTLDLDNEREIMQKMGKLLDNIVNKHEFIGDIDTLTEVFEINGLDELEKRELILQLMDYNKGVYEEKLA